MKSQQEIIEVHNTKCGCGLQVVATDRWEITENGLWYDCSCKSTRLIPVYVESTLAQSEGE